MTSSSCAAPRRNDGGALSKMLDDSVPAIVFEDDGPPLTASDLKEKLRKNLERVIDSFRKFDKDNSGSSTCTHTAAAHATRRIHLSSSSSSSHFSLAWSLPSQSTSPSG